jgi:hypothetical protein
MNDPQVPAHLDYVFEMRVDFRPERCLFGPLPGGGSQGYTPCAGGTIYGPRLSGRVVPDSGADYATVRGDGTIIINSHYLLEADDGTKIYINNNGYLVPAKPGTARSTRARPSRPISASRRRSWCQRGRTTGWGGR